MPHPPETSFRNRTFPSRYDMGTQLRYEDAHKHKVNLLFAGHGVEDISADKATRKSGTDFLLSPYLSQGQFGEPISCENKFETHLSGNAAVEFISVDRRNFTPGWLVTSKAAWLLYWYENGEMLAMFMDEVRKVVFERPGQFGATTAANKGYLTWNALEPLERLARIVDSARIVNYGKEFGEEPALPSLFSANLNAKRCSADDLVAHMQRYPRSTKPMLVSEEELQAIARHLAPKDRRRVPNKKMRDALSWLN